MSELWTEIGYVVITVIVMGGASFGFLFCMKYIARTLDKWESDEWR